MIMIRRKKMKSNNINSLDDLIKRKKNVRKEMLACENQMVDEYYAFAHPVSNLVHLIQNKKNNRSFVASGFYKFALNTKRVMDIVRLGTSIYNDYKK